MRKTEQNPVHVAPVPVREYSVSDVYEPASEREDPLRDLYPTMTFWWANTSVKMDSQVSMTTYRMHVREGLVEARVTEFPELAALRPDWVRGNGERFIQDGQVLMVATRKWGDQRLQVMDAKVNSRTSAVAAKSQFSADAKPDPTMPVEATPVSSTSPMGGGYTPAFRE